MAQQEKIARGEIVLLFQDESHLLWGDVSGYCWGKRNEKIPIPIGNQRLKQTYYGALNYQTHEFHLQAYPSGNGEHTVSYLQWLRELYSEAKQIWIIWDGASYHRGGKTKEYLQELNTGKPEEEWPIVCTLFAPNAPEQNPVEDVWLKGKRQLRKLCLENQTFHKVKQCFSSYLSNITFETEKYQWYSPETQSI